MYADLSVHQIKQLEKSNFRVENLASYFVSLFLCIRLKLLLIVKSFKINVSAGLR